MRVVKDFTLELRELYDIAVRLESYADALKAKTWVSDKKLSNAILAEKLAYQDFWKCVSATFPESKGNSSSSNKDGTVYWDVPDKTETK